jgi:MYXO-CTERM domain-containing protein
VSRTIAGLALIGASFTIPVVAHAQTTAPPTTVVTSQVKGTVKVPTNSVVTKDTTKTVTSTKTVHADAAQDSDSKAGLWGLLGLLGLAGLAGLARRRGRDDDVLPPSPGAAAAPRSTGGATRGND